ncbi:M23 family metallopeptidase [Candidatus Poribacteria bacterium]
MDSQGGTIRQAWGNAVYVDFAIGESHTYLGKTARLISVENNFCTVEVDGEQRELIVARRSLPEVMNGVRVFVADNRNVADLTQPEKSGNVHAALTKDALLCLSDPARPLLNPEEYIFPVSRADGFDWNMSENSHMFAYLFPTRSHEGVDIDMSDARGMEIHAILAPEDGTVHDIINTPGSDIETRPFIQSDSNPELTYYYSHINRHKLLVRPGQHVSRGQKLGYIWGDWKWGHLHFSVRKYSDGQIEPNGFEYLLNTFPQMYELWHGDLEPRPKVWISGSFRFGGQYWTRGNRQHLNQYDDILGYGWLLGNWCTAGKVETSLPDDGGKPDQSARLQKVMFQGSPSPAVNPSNYFDFEIAVENGWYGVGARIGDVYAKTWQRVCIEGTDAGVYELDHELRSIPDVKVLVTDGKLTVRLELRDDGTCAGIHELNLTRMSL